MLLCWQVALGIYMSNMFKTMLGACMDMEAKLEMMGHPNRFPSTPKATTAEWDRLQTSDYKTLKTCYVVEGTAGAWNAAVAAVYADVYDLRTLWTALRTVDRDITPTKDARVLLMPTKALLRKLSDEDDAELMACVNVAARNYLAYFVRGELVMPDGSGQEYDLDTALGMMESFHLLEIHEQRWSPVHMFKCNCTEHFKNASCHHSLLAGMMCDRSISIPNHCLTVSIQSRRKRGRPLAMASEVGDVGEEKA